MSTKTRAGRREVKELEGKLSEVEFEQAKRTTCAISNFYETFPLFAISVVRHTGMKATYMYQVRSETDKQGEGGRGG